MPQYQGVWTLPVAARLQSNQQWVTDPLFDYTTLLLQADNAPNGAQNNTFIDSSSNNFTITRNGNTTQGTFTPYSLQPGAWSNFFSSGQSNYIQTPATVPSITGDYTAEAWVYITSLPNVGVIFSLNASEFELWVNTNNTVSYYTGGSIRITTNATVSLNVWTHIALVRSSGVAKIYINGVADSSTYNSSATIGSGTAFLYFGRDGGVSGGFNGYISNARLAIGASVYTSNFTPSPVPLGATSGGQNPPTGTQTYVLTCQSNRFIDNSASPVTLTITGTPSVQAFSPFAPQYQWTAPVIGGSGYFDGTGDYLSATGSSATQMGTGAFTWECWCYITTTASYQCLIDTRTSPSSGSSTGMALLLDTGTFTPIAATTGTILTSSINVQRNAWNHVALTRTSGGTLTIWVNGASGGTVSNSTNLTDTALWVGGNNTSPFPAPVNGYLSNTRITKGADLYTATFTPPTAPLTTTVSSGTVGFLLNYTNAGIYDGTMKNNLETVGNAQISTSVVKYGTGSMAFDGSGDYLVVGNMATNPNLALLAGDFTIEYWYYPLNTNIHATLNNLDDFNGNGSLWILMNGTFSGGSKVQFGYNTGSISNILFGTGTFATNQWYHIAITRQGSAMRCFINGIQEGATNTGIGSGSIQAFNRNLVIGATLSNTTYSAYNLNGYLDDFRLTKGIARYTANFTPPTVALPRQ